ncbi:beta-propeller domain-containing protein [Anaerobacillus sp. HL2]|nr:beta-propeller domain-containing protein [Anaerobacillus sp. HL2]
MALFDITDVNNPKEKFVEIIGGRGTHSTELLYNHKALLTFL